MDVLSIPLLIITIHPIGGRGNQTRDDQTTIKNDGTADETGIRMPAVISLEQVSMIMVIRRGRIGLVGNGYREGWRRDVDLQPIENKVLSWGIIGKSAPILADITIRKSQAIFMTQTGLLRQGVQDDGYTTRNYHLFIRLQSPSDQSLS